MATQLKVVAIERVSTDGIGTQAEGASMRGAFDASGTTLVMQTGAPLVADDLNGYSDIYLKDLASGLVERVTLAPALADPEQGGWDPAISADGERLAFVTTYFFTYEGRPWAAESLFYKNLLSGDIRLISAAADGTPGNDASLGPMFSPDGTKIAFTSHDDTLIPGNTQVGWGVFLKDIASGAIQILSSDASGVASNGNSLGAGFSPDGTFFAFSSDADNLIADDHNGASDVFLKDLGTGEVRRVSIAADGTEANGGSSGGSFSPDGSKLLFASRASNLVAGDLNGSMDLFVKDLATGAITLVSTDSLGNQWSGDSHSAGFSPDGTKIAFVSDTSSLAVRDDNAAQDVFVKDLRSGSVTALSASLDGEIGNAQSFWPRFVPDGSGVLFTSYASNLVAQDTNAAADLFVASFSEQTLGGAVQWREADGGNDHWYEYIEAPLSWAEARADAESRSHQGLPGYLATITSEAENAFVLAHTPPNVWAGGSDAGSEGVWTWRGGPEAGQTFWTTATGALGFSDWGGAEPNDAGGEDFLLLHALYPEGTWADAGVPPNPNSSFGYVVEYSDLALPAARLGLGRTEAETLANGGSFVVKPNPHASGGLMLQAQDGTEAVAAGSFTGPAGLYSVIVGYFDESDGISSMALEVNGTVQDTWVWAADSADSIVTAETAARRVLPSIALAPGDVVTLTGSADGGEPLRTDYVEIRPAPPAAGAFTVEAETFEILKDFEVWSNPHASGGAYLQAGGGPDQRAAYDFDGPAGRYDITVGYFDESDGVSEMRVRLNGAVLDSWQWDGDFGDAIVTAAGAARYTLPNVALTSGDRIELDGQPDGGEPLRTDFLIFDPIAATASADAFLFM